MKKYLQILISILLSTIIAFSLVSIGLSDLSKYFGNHIDYIERKWQGNLSSLGQNLGASIPKVVALFETTLASKITSTDTSMTLVSGTDKSGDSLSGYICFTIDEGSADEEFVCGTASGTAITSMIRGIDPIDGDLEVSSLKKSHRRGSSVKITNYPSLGVLTRILNGDETLPNKLKYDSNKTFTLDTELISKKYADDLAIAGSADASTTTKGILEFSTEEELRSGTSSGGTTAFLGVLNSFFNATSSATTLVPVSGTDGKLSQGFWDLTELFNFTGGLTSSSTTLSGIFTSSATSTHSGQSTFTGSLFASSTAQFSTTTFDVIPTAPTSTPTSANQLSTKSYTDTKLSGFGTWDTSKSIGTTYQASTDLIVMASEYNCGGNFSLIGITDSNATPTAEVIKTTTGTENNITFAVKKDDYWKITENCGSGSPTKLLRVLPLE